jgi:hypothetical protein
MVSGLPFAIVRYAFNIVEGSAGGTGSPAGIQRCFSS